jgi:hypothetical protein
VQASQRPLPGILSGGTASASIFSLLMIIFPLFPCEGKYIPLFQTLACFKQKKIKIIKFKMMTEHIAAFFFQTSGRLKAWRASRHSRGASGPRKKIL